MNAALGSALNGGQHQGDLPDVRRFYVKFASLIAASELLAADPEVSLCFLVQQLCPLLTSKFANLRQPAVRVRWCSLLFRSSLGSALLTAPSE
jgi:hypothetical protein